jgi:hypothetical protein
MDKEVAGEHGVHERHLNSNLPEGFGAWPI